MMERITSVLLIPLTIAMLWIIVPIIGSDYGTVSESLSRPVAAIIIALFFLVTLKHLQDGIQVVLEDYVHSPSAFKMLTLFNKLFCWSFGLAAIFAVLKIAFFA